MNPQLRVEAMGTSLFPEPHRLLPERMDTRAIPPYTGNSAKTSHARSVH
jgi:hypothetical protein